MYNKGDMALPRSGLRALAILLLIVGVLTLQAASLSPDHSESHASHCCAVCHLAHAPATGPAQVLHVAAPAASAWFVPVEEGSSYREALYSDTHSRAPPA